MELTNTIFFAIFFIASLLYLRIPVAASRHANVTAIFAFGDSTVDSGNNNHIAATLFRSDHLPYGRDLPGQVSSGRFCDGKLVTDFLVASLGIKELLPAYLDQSVTDSDLLTGVSFASAGSGLDPQTLAFTLALDLPTQLNYFDDALQRIERRVGAAEAHRIVENALFLISVGSNDMLFNFYDLPQRALEYSIPDYHQMQLQTLESVIQRLYRAGARRIAVAGLPPIGCLPVQVTVGSILPTPHFLQRACVDQQNLDSQAYNEKLDALITSILQTGPHDARVVYVDIYSPIMDMIENPAKYGFAETLQACCGTGLVEMGPLCNALAPTCPDASKFVFWDAVHLTEAAYGIIADVSIKTLLPRLVGRPN